MAGAAVAASGYPSRLGWASLAVAAAGCVAASYAVAPLAPVAAAAVLLMLVLAYQLPAVALTVAVALSPLEAVQLPVGAAGSLSPSKAGFLLVAVGYLLRLTRGAPVVRPSLRDWPIVALIASLLPGAVLGAPLTGIAKLLVLWTAFYLVFLTVQSLQPAQVRRVLVALAGGAAVLAIGGIIGYVNNGGAQLGNGGAAATGRASSGIADPNYYAAYLQIAALPAFALAVLAGTRRRLLVALAPLVVFAAVLVSLSRGAILALVVALAVVLGAAWVASTARTRAMVLAIGAVVLAAAVLGGGSLTRSGVGGVVSTRLDSIGVASSDNNRLQLWSASVHVIEAHPLFGLGALQFEREAERRGITERGQPLSHAHSIVFNLGAELGLVGLGAYLAWLVRIARDLRTEWRRRRRQTRPFVVALAAALLGFVVQGLTVTSYLVEIIQSTFFLLAGVAAALHRWPDERDARNDDESDRSPLAVAQR